MLEALHLHVGVVCHQSWDQGLIHVLMVHNPHVGVVFHRSWDQGLIQVHMVHRPDVTGSFLIHMFRFQATRVISMRTTTETEMTELDHGTSSIVVVVSPQSCVSCGIRLGVY